MLDVMGFAVSLGRLFPTCHNLKKMLTSVRRLATSIFLVLVIWQTLTSLGKLMSKETDDNSLSKQQFFSAPKAIKQAKFHNKQMDALIYINL